MAWFCFQPDDNGVNAVNVLHEDDLLWLSRADRSPAELITHAMAAQIWGKRGRVRRQEIQPGAGRLSMPFIAGTTKTGPARTLRLGEPDLFLNLPLVAGAASKARKQP